MSSNLGLYLATVLIWGSTWLAIKFQLGGVAPAVSVAWRFAAAAVMLLGIAALRRMPLRFGLRNHGWLALQGLLLFGINYVLIYLAEVDLTSGLVAVSFSLVALFNIAFLRLFFGVPMKPHTLAGAVLGVAGVALLFWPDVAGFALAPQRAWALASCVGATVSAALGNMAATRNHRHGIPVISGNVFAMGYGALFVALYAAACGLPFRFEATWPYVASWLYLAAFGSVAAFIAYLTLLGRIGADRAGYSGVATPVMAMLLSTFFERLQWSPWIVAGMLLCLTGNLLVLAKAR